jgi:hypothetical protein
MDTRIIERPPQSIIAFTALRTDDLSVSPDAGRPPATSPETRSGFATKVHGGTGAVKRPRRLARILEVAGGKRSISLDPNDLVSKTNQARALIF